MFIHMYIYIQNRQRERVVCKEPGSAPRGEVCYVNSRVFARERERELVVACMRAEGGVSIYIYVRVGES